MSSTRPDEPRVLASRLRMACTSVALGEPLALRHLTRQVGGGHDDRVGAFERVGEVLLEHARARGVGAGLERPRARPAAGRSHARSARSVSRTAVGWCAKSS